MQIVKFIFVLVALLGVQIIKAQNVGIGNTDPKAKLDVSGDLNFKKFRTYPEYR
ncbi:MAG: hypothetical protein IPO92_17065 [Saprospiraceae bacterium]|nr:hypothetical protein [Saprospiraceae bacterium]